ncbi:L-threonine transporter, anaerobically inducible [Klebsiella pneumoniae subsp. rhinoscleromatis]|nr:L-threonine transporter, anaerobically inducible [Klebsiella pneumoniae subsp. rhinoscleromatis]
MGSTWVVAYANPNILDLIEAMGARRLSPRCCACCRCTPFVKRLRWPKYRGRLDNLFVTAIGLLTILNIAYKLF